MMYLVSAVILLFIMLFFIALAFGEDIKDAFEAAIGLLLVLAGAALFVHLITLGLGSVQ